MLEVNLLGGDEEDFVASLLDAFLGAGDADVGAGVVRPGDSDLGGGLQLQLLQLLSVLPDDKAVVLLRDGHCSRSLQGGLEGARLRRPESCFKVFRKLLAALASDALPAFAGELRSPCEPS